jgi:hypothetical protein
MNFEEPADTDLSLEPHVFYTKAIPEKRNQIETLGNLQLAEIQETTPF